MQQSIVRVSFNAAEGAEGNIFRASDDGIYRASVSSENSDIMVGYYDEDTDQYMLVRQVLLHGEENVDLSILRNRAPILFNHDTNLNVGQIASATLIRRRLEVEFKIAPSDFARAKQVEIDAGFLWSMSIGGHVVKRELKRVTLPTGETELQMHVTRWQPFEASLCNTPADNTVGVVRNADAELSADIRRQLKFINQGEPPMDNPTPQDPTPTDPKLLRTTPPPELPADELEKLRRAGANAERERMTEIRKIADQVNMMKEGKKQELLRAAESDGCTPEQFSNRVLRELSENQDAVEHPGEVGLSRKELGQYRLSRLIDNLINGKQEGIEYELARHLAKIKYGSDAPITRGGQPAVIVPMDVLNDTARAVSKENPMGIRREVTTGNAGELVGTIHDAASFIDTLRDRSVILNTGAMILTGLVGSTDIPQKDDNAAYVYIGEGADGNTTDLNFSTKELRIHTISGGVGFTRRMQQQGTPGIEAIIYNDLIDGAALAIDTAAIAGTGAGNQPTGLLNTDGINTHTWAANAFDWADVVEFSKLLAEDNAMINDPAFILTPAMHALMQTTKKDAGSGIFLMNEDGRLNGSRVFRKNGDLPANTILYGDFRQLMIGFWEMLELSLDTATKAASGGIIVRSWIDLDVNVRHAVSFVKGSQA